MITPILQKRKTRQRYRFCNCLKDHIAREWQSWGFSRDSPVPDSAPLSPVTLPFGAHTPEQIPFTDEKVRLSRLKVVWDLESGLHPLSAFLPPESFIRSPSFWSLSPPLPASSSPDPQAKHGLSFLGSPGSQVAWPVCKRLCEPISLIMGAKSGPGRMCYRTPLPLPSTIPC